MWGCAPGQEANLLAHRPRLPGWLWLAAAAAGAAPRADAVVVKVGMLTSGRQGLGFLPSLTGDSSDRIAELPEPPQESLLEINGGASTRDRSALGSEEAPAPTAGSADSEESYSNQAPAPTAGSADSEESYSNQLRRSQAAASAGAVAAATAAAAAAESSSVVVAVAGKVVNKAQQELLDEAKHKIQSLPSYCDAVSGVPHASMLRAQAFSRLTRLHLRNVEMRTPSDPVEWACSHPWSAWFMYGLVFWAGMTMVAFIYASFWYRGKIPRFEEHSRLDPEATFMHDHFGCMSDVNSCLCAFVFPAVRWADNMHMAGILSFWFAFWILTVCELPALLFGAFGFVLVAPLVVYRQRLREKLGIASGNETYITDCCYACFCSCCLIAQEARVVKEAYVVGHPMVPVSGGRVD